MTRAGVLIFISFFIYLLVQVMLMKNLVLFNTAFCFLYAAFILFLPIETNTLALMLIGFVMGFLVDIFYDSLGLHACSLVAIGYVRNYWLGTITPQGGYDAGAAPTIAANGTQWFLTYTIPLLFLHHFILFFVEAGGFSGFGFTLLKTVMSMFFTLIALVLLQFFQPRQRRL